MSDENIGDEVLCLTDLTRRITILEETLPLLTKSTIEGVTLVAKAIDDLKSVVAKVLEIQHALELDYGKLNQRLVKLERK